MTEQEYLEFIHQVSFLKYKAPHLDIRDIAHDIFLDEGSIPERIGRYRNKIVYDRRTSAICCGGDVEEYIEQIKAYSPLTNYKYCSHCDQILPESEFRNNNGSLDKLCKTASNATKAKEQKSSRGNLSDTYLKDILKKLGKPITPEAIEERRQTILDKRKRKEMRQASNSSYYLISKTFNGKTKTRRTDS